MSGMNEHQRSAALACLAFILAALTTACGSLRPQATAVPVEIVFQTPVDEIVGGVRLAPPEPSWDGYGEAIDVRGEVLVIGASEWNICGPGSAYVYRFSEGEWREEAQLVASDRDVFIQQARQFEAQRFGSSVVLGEGIIAIGAPGNAYPIAGGYTGAVYLFEYDGRTWVETTKLTPGRPDPEPAPIQATPSVCGRMARRSFGALVALDGDTLAIGGDSATNSVYIYQRGENSWQEQARLLVPGSPGRDLYMVSQVLFGDTLAVSALYLPPQPDQAPVLTGNVTVYVFERNGDDWKESFRFTPEDSDADVLFFGEVNVGASVALGGVSGQAKLLAVGLPGFPDWSGVQDHIGMFGVSPEQIPEFPKSNRETGAVYIFERTEKGGWTQLATLKPAGWENPPGPGSLFSGVPPVTESEQGDFDGASGVLDHLYRATQAASGEQGSIDEADFYASFVFPGHVFSEAPEITFFGATVDLDGNRLAVTAGFSNATYVFERRDEGWVYRFSITPGNEKGELWEDSAQVVRISGDILLLGTPSEFGNSAYVFRLLPESER